MTQQSNNTHDSAPHPKQPTQINLYAQTKGIFLAIWSSKQRDKLFVLGIALVSVISATAYAQLQLNAWNKPFYNALSQKNVTVFIEQLGVFMLLASVLLVLNVAQVWLNQKSKVLLREGLVNDLLSDWLAPRRAFLLSYSGEIGANPDQRIHEDTKHLTELTTDLSIGLLQSSLLLMSFIGVLWALSGHSSFDILGFTFTQPPGYMVLYALLYASVASYISWRVGRPLIDLNAERYAHEAEMRFALVRVNEEIDGVTLSEGETDEKARIVTIFHTVLDVSNQIVRAMTRLTWVTAGYGWFTIVAPILVAAPAYFQGTMSFGELMVISGAFNQVQQCLRWFVDNFANIADWRATMLRVATFRITVLQTDEIGQDASRIAFEDSKDQTIRIDDLHIASTSGSLKLSETHIEMNPGDRVLITGENSEEKALLFRAIGGLWPWGSGKITRPHSEAIMFMPMRPYISPGTLRSVISYPRSIHEYETAAIEHTLARVGLEHLVESIDDTERWDRKLNYNEKQRLSFARVLLHKPSWIVSDGALYSLLESSARIKTIFNEELTQIGVIGIRDPDEKGQFFKRNIILALDHTGPSISLPAETDGINLKTFHDKMPSAQQ